MIAGSIFDQPSASRINGSGSTNAPAMNIGNASNLWISLSALKPPACTRYSAVLPRMKRWKCQDESPSHAAIQMGATSGEHHAATMRGFFINA